MSHEIARAFSDIHLNRFQAFGGDNRLNKSLNAWWEIVNDCKVPVLFMGDLYHNPKELENEVITASLQHYNEIHEKNGIHLYAISGNHDQSKENYYTEDEYRAPSYLRGFEHFKTFHRMDHHVVSLDHFNLMGIPYYTRDADLVQSIEDLSNAMVGWNLPNKPNILMLHSDAPGAETPEGIVINTTDAFPKKLDKLFKAWDLVLFGHIHKPQQLSKKCWMMGSPIHQTAGDEGIKMGYWSIQSDLSMNFVHLKKFPKFIHLKENEKPYNAKDYFIPFSKANAESITLQQKEFDINQSRKQLAKNYCNAKGIQDKEKQRLLIKILNHAD